MKDRGLAQFAAQIQPIDSHRQLQSIRQAVHDHIIDKDVDTVFGNAAETYKSQRGDCTEHAMLAAAVCRLRQIPARLVVGLRYNHEVGAMIYHMWTEAWVGDAWQSFDAVTNTAVGLEYLRFQHSPVMETDYSLVRPILPVVGKMEMRISGKLKVES